jgi:hypothetical protein
MLTTVVAVFAALALLVPGFLVAEIALARGARSSRSDLELALRSLVSALVIHLAFLPWTACLVERVGEVGNWHDHVGALVVYAIVVLLVVPTTLGVGLNITLSAIEARDGPPPLWAAALGAGQARDAYDFAFQRVSGEGAWVIVELVGHTAETPRLAGGLYGRGSAVGQTPSSHDIYLEQMCVVAVDERGLGHLIAKTDPPRGLYIPAEQIARVEVLPPAS